jgi:hypothetical protein
LKRRKPIPKWVKYVIITSQKACCKDCGWPLPKPTEQKGAIHYDHRPPLADREWIEEELQDYWPPQHDPRYLDALCVKCHDIRTNGPGGDKRITTAGSDSHRRAHTRALHRKTAKHEQRMADKAAGRPKPRSRWPSRPLRSASRWPKKRFDKHHRMRENRP